MEDKTAEPVCPFKDSVVYVLPHVTCVKQESPDCQEDGQEHVSPISLAQPQYDHVHPLVPHGLVGQVTQVPDLTDPVIHIKREQNPPDLYLGCPLSPISDSAEHEEICGDPMTVNGEDGRDIKTIQMAPTVSSVKGKRVCGLLLQDDTEEPQSLSPDRSPPFPIILFPNQTHLRGDVQVDGNGGAEIQLPETDVMPFSGDPDSLPSVVVEGNSLSILSDCDVPQPGLNNEDTSDRHSFSDDQSSQTGNSVAQPSASAEGKPYTCLICNCHFASRSAQIIHMRIHVGEKPHICSVCDYRFAHRCDLVKHTRTHTGEKPHMCSQCAYMCSNRYDLTTHMRIHTGEKPHLCSRCAYRCAHRSDLLKHMATHTGEKPHTCSQCSYKSANKSTLRAHIRTHTGEKPFTCTQCPYRSSRKAALITHMRIHTGEKPFMCSVCVYRCAHQSDLARHMKTHTGHAGEKPHMCSVCVYRSVRKSDLARHMKTHTRHAGGHIETKTIAD